MFSGSAGSGVGSGLMVIFADAEVTPLSIISLHVPHPSVLATLIPLLVVSVGLGRVTVRFIGLGSDLDPPPPIVRSREIKYPKVTRCPATTHWL